MKLEDFNIIKNPSIPSLPKQVLCPKCNKEMEVGHRFSPSEDDQLAPVNMLSIMEYDCPGCTYIVHMGYLKSIN